MTTLDPSGTSTAGRESVAVIGAGISGITAAYLLQRKYDVTLFEAERRPGGHAHTHDVQSDDKGPLAVDSGFIVHNETTYPNLLRLFGELGVATQPTEMSMSVRCNGCGLEYAGARGLGGILAQPRRLAHPSYLRMLSEVLRFHREAKRLLQETSEPSLTTLREFLTEGGYTPYFIAHFMVPLVSAVWSAAPGACLQYPAAYLFEFLDNHGMLSVTGSHPWRTVSGGSREYVRRAIANLSAIELGTGIQVVVRTGSTVELRDQSDKHWEFDRVVIATHADTALELLADPTRDEKEVLSAFTYSLNDTVLHTDESVMPRTRRAQASWNYQLASCDADTDKVLVTYDMNRLQQLDAHTRYLVTLNAGRSVSSDSALARMQYSHPIFTPESVAAQSRLASLVTDRTAFAGAYHGWGFHEDGCRSGVAAAAAFGVNW